MVYSSVSDCLRGGAPAAATPPPPKKNTEKVSLHCPAFLRAPLEVTSTALELWSTAVLFSCVSEQATLQALDVLLLEKTLVVCGRDLGMVRVWDFFF